MVKCGSNSIKSDSIPGGRLEFFLSFSVLHTEMCMISTHIYQTRTLHVLTVMYDFNIPISTQGEAQFDYKPYFKEIYSCTLHRLKAADIDQEVKERAISCM